MSLRCARCTTQRQANRHFKTELCFQTKKNTHAVSEKKTLHTLTAKEKHDVAILLYTTHIFHPWCPLRAKVLGGASVSVHLSTKRGSVSAPGARQASFFDHSPPMPVFAPTSPNNLEYLLAVSRNLAHPLHPLHDDGKGGGWKWWE